MSLKLKLVGKNFFIKNAMLCYYKSDIASRVHFLRIEFVFDYLKIGSLSIKQYFYAYLMSCISCNQSKIYKIK